MTVAKGQQQPAQQNCVRFLPLAELESTVSVAGLFVVQMLQTVRDHETVITSQARQVLKAWWLRSDQGVWREERFVAGKWITVSG